MKYEILSSTSISRLEGTVNSYMNMGFVPAGGVNTVYHGLGNVTFFQAMVDYENSKDKQQKSDTGSPSSAESN